ncbi:hypothetical protein ACOMCU_16290 [Lysinibacillus sp. UGB7]|uniref:hypothetical protein n=1 Tax=Lysinibacillus sp. UGB7 TaxID=3411039 RepID=UPI003B77A23A
MGWYRKPEEYQCNDCGEKYEFILDTMFMARNPGRPGKCPKCKSKNVKKLTND